MARAMHYSPVIRRFLVKVLYHEARHRRKPMTVLTSEILSEALQGTEGWRRAEEETSKLSENHPLYCPKTP